MACNPSDFDPLPVSEFAAALTEIVNPMHLGEPAPRAINCNAEFTPQRMAAPATAWATG